MATTDEIATVKAMLGSFASQFTDTDIGLAIDAAGGDLNLVAGEYWGQIAASTATMVNISESGSSRSMGDVYKNAIAMSKFYSGKSETETAETESRPRTRRIERV